MPRGIQRKGIIRRNKILRSAVKLFLEGGYEKTTTANIAQAAGMAPSSFFAAFENKEALLYTLTESMFESQFDNAEKLIGAARIRFWCMRWKRRFRCISRSFPSRSGSCM